MWQNQWCGSGLIVSGSRILWIPIQNFMNPDPEFYESGSRIWRIRIRIQVYNFHKLISKLFLLPSLCGKTSDVNPDWLYPDQEFYEFVSGSRILWIRIRNFMKLYPDPEFYESESRIWRIRIRIQVYNFPWLISKHLLKVKKKFNFLESSQNLNLRHQLSSGKTTLWIVISCEK